MKLNRWLMITVLSCISGAAMAEESLTRYVLDIDPTQVDPFAVATREVGTKEVSFQSVDGAIDDRIDDAYRAKYASQEATMKIRLTIDGRALEATLLDNATARDFLSLLPVTLTLEDYASTEKISYLPRKLSSAGAPAGVDPAPGDIAYYAPWGNLAIFYEDAGYANGLIKLGHFDASVDALKVRGSIKAMIERHDK